MWRSVPGTTGAAEELGLRGARCSLKSGRQEWGSGGNDLGAEYCDLVQQWCFKFLR